MWSCFPPCSSSLEGLSIVGLQASSSLRSVGLRAGTSVSQDIRSGQRCGRKDFLHSKGFTALLVDPPLT